jgi:CRP/FNR family transcriptional regulator, cyclic AMP receptor protein
MKWRLLADVPDEQVHLLLTVARRRRFARGEVVFHRDDPADSLHLIAAGHFVARVMTPLGDTVTVALLGPGDNFGEMALLETPEARRAATIEALEASETFAVYSTDFAELRKQNPSIDRILIAFLVGQVRMLDERLLEALYLPAERRVLRRLVDLALLYGGTAETGAELPLTQEELATFAGASRATVNRVLRDEEKRGTVELRRGKTIVLDLGALTKRAR